MTGIRNVSEISRDIKEMKIRGAGNIARHAARALIITAQQSKSKEPSMLMEELETSAKLLLQTRPTAVSLPNSIRYVMLAAKKALEQKLEFKKFRQSIVNTANDFIRNSEKAILEIGKIGSELIEDGDLIITHCNSAAVIEIFRTAFNQGKDFKITA